MSVSLSAVDAKGHCLEQEVTTVNVSRHGALLGGVRGKLRVGDRVSLARSGHEEQFQVAWVAGENSPKAGQIGVAAADLGTFFWSEVVET
jgi:hypothetical protein